MLITIIPECRLVQPSNVIKFYDTFVGDSFILLDYKNFYVRLSVPNNTVHLEIIYPEDSVIRGKMADFLFRIKNRFYISRFEEIAFGTTYLLEAVFLSFLQKDRTLLHASCVVDDNGRALAIAGESGIGKTTLALKLITKGGWKFLSDDICFLGRNGEVSLNPRYCVIYPYVVQTNSVYLRNLLRHRSLLDRLHWTILQRRPFNKTVARYVSPAELLGADKIGSQGRLFRLIYLSKTNTNEITVSNASSNLLSKWCASILFSEYNYFFKNYYFFKLSHLPMKGLADIVNRCRIIYREAFDSVDCKLIRIPSNMKYNAHTIEEVLSRIMWL